MFTVATKGLPTPLETPQNWSSLFHDFLSQVCAFFFFGYSVWFLIGILLQCLQQDPSARPTATQLLKHPFIEQATSPQAMEELLSKVFVKNLLEQSGMYVLLLDAPTLR